MENIFSTKLTLIAESLRLIVPELILSAGVLLSLLITLIFRIRRPLTFFSFFTAAILLINIILITVNWDSAAHARLFGGMIQYDGYSSALKIIFDIAGLLTAFLVLSNDQLQSSEKKAAEFNALLLSGLLGAHFLVMSVNLVMVFLSIELLSISSYVLAGFTNSANASEGSLKYFMYGSVVSAVMLYGFSILYGLSGTLDFSSTIFLEHLLQRQGPLLFIGGLFALAGYLFKVAAVPMHVWAPDVYEAAPMPVVAWLSVVPKVAGIGALAKFVLGINLFGQSAYDWQVILVIIAIGTLTFGNFSALWQRHPKRLMAYSSIAQSGFMMAAVLAFSIQGIQFFLFYAGGYMVMNYLVFLFLQHAERNRLQRIDQFAGQGRQNPWQQVLLLFGFVGLAGIPPTIGFMSKFFVFSAIWEAYSQSGKEILFWLIVFGLLNTVVSLFFYLKIPYFAFLKNGIPSGEQAWQKTTNLENFMAGLLVLLVVGLFLMPGLLMGWLNSINLVL